MAARSFALFILLSFLGINVFANDYEEAWKALHRNDRKTAMQYLQKAFDDPATTADAYITYIYLSTFEGREGKINDFIPRVYDKLNDPNPYVYAMWFNSSVLGTYGKKTAGQLNLLQKIFTDGKCNGSIQAAAHYMYGWHYQASNNIPQSAIESGKMNQVGPLWQLAGPFDNMSGSGFNKEFGPLKHPEAGAVFKSVNNADVTWFTPSEMTRTGWTFPHPHIGSNTAVVYAQCFINAPEDMKVLLNAGTNGALKVWVNDEPVIAEKKDLVTELDYYKNYTQLKKGYNRLLVQLCYSDNSFPNFSIRLTDDKLMPVNGLTYSASSQQYTPVVTGANASPSIKHFAEVFFENKIKNDPENIINYILLSQTYQRDRRITEARSLLQDLLKKYPDNSLLRLELMGCYQKEGNNTLLSQEIERMKEKDPDCMLAAMLNINQLMQSEKYQEADEALKKYDARFDDEDDEMLKTKVKLYSNQKRMEELIKLVETAYKKNPENALAVSLMFKVKMNINKDAKGALELYEKYLKNNFNYEIVKELAEQYKNLGMADKELKTLEYLAKSFGYDPEQQVPLISYYFSQQNYTKAAEIARKTITLAPYVSAYWENLGLQMDQLHNDKEASDAYKKAIFYNANSYSAREQLRKIEKKPSVWKAFPETDEYELIRKSDTTIKDYNFYYLLDQKFAVVYPEGASEEYYTYVVKILNEKGIDSWKEMNISYNSNSSYLVVEKAETVKRNGVKTPAEQNDNQVVFTGLEVGDVIIVKYKLQNYYVGRLAKNYWNKFIFNSFVPEKLSRFCLLIAGDNKLKYSALNTQVKPEVKPFNDFTLYTWQMNNTPALKSETYMPPLGDVGASVTVSTVPSWADIAGWYSDLSAEKTDSDFEVKQVFNQLFPKGTTGISQKEIAKTIYRYIGKNIRYSSVSFRQSAFTPQKASVTINTALGDCKDLSTLFVALSKMAGIKSNLVLVNTRDNGKKTMPLPSVEFNHCIVQTLLDSKLYFLELTDNTLPFGSLPANLYQAEHLVIPANSSDTAGVTLAYINAVNRTPVKLARKSRIVIDGSDVKQEVYIKTSGSYTSGLRDKYSNLSQEDQLKEIEKSISSHYKNAVNVDGVSFNGLDKMEDTISYNCRYIIKDEISELGDLRMMKIPFEDIVGTVDNFSVNQRNFPVEYYRYEDADEYETNLEITAPVGTKFIEVPKDEQFTFMGSSYTLKYVLKDNNHLSIVRKSLLKRSDVSVEDYLAMKQFLNNIVKAESKYIAFKKV